MAHELQQRVQATRETWNRRATVELVCWLVAGVAALGLAAGLVDYLFRFTDRGMRILVSLAALSGVVWLVWRLARRWRRTLWSDLVAAARMQQTFPQLGDRLASAIEFLQQTEEDRTAGSPAMRRAVVAQTTAAIEGLPLGEVANSPTLRKAGLAVAILGIGLVGLWLVRPDIVGTAVARIAAPWNDVDWPRRHTLEFVDPPRLVARGSAFEVALVDKQGRLPAEVVFEYRWESEGRRRSDTQRMQRVGDTMVARRDKVTQSFAYRAVGGDHHSMSWHQVEVVDPPAAESLTTVVHSPAYTGLAPASLGGKYRVLDGSSIELRGEANRPLDQVWLDRGKDEPLPVATQGDERRQFALNSGEWKLAAGEQGERPVEWNLRFIGTDGLVGTTPVVNLRVVADSPPQVAWGESTDDLHVLPTAVVPLQVVVADNLAISSAQLVLTILPPAESTTESPGDKRREEVVSLYQGPELPPSREELPASGGLLDRQSFAYALELATLELPVGTTVEIEARASDYRPGIGKTSSARRMTLLSLADLEARLAATQASILRLLEQALADERSARQQSSELRAAAPQGAEALRAHLDHLVRNRLEQQKVRRILTAPREGVVDLVRNMRQQVEINQLDRADLVSQLAEIVQVIGQLDAGPLPRAEQSLTDLRKQTETQLAGPPAPPSPQTAATFDALLVDQQEVVVALERLVERVAAWSDADRFLRELARLEQEQERLRSETAAAAVRQAQARALRQGEGVTEEQLQSLADRQADVSRRLARLAQDMQQRINEPENEGDLAQRLSDALAEANSSDLLAQMSEGARQIASEQLGRASETQADAVETLREMLELLRNRPPTDPAELAARLRQMQQELAELQREAAEAAGMQNPQQQNEARQKLAEKLERAARQLNRLTASHASQSTQQAAEQAGPQGESPEQAHEKLNQAQQQIEQAQQQLAQRIEELEEQRQQRLLERLAVVLDDLIPRHQHLLGETLRLESAQLAGEGSEGLAARSEGLAGDQSQIADELSEAIADLAPRAVFQLALRGAEADMRQASRGLEQTDAGRITQQLQLSALSRMRHVRDVLREPPPQGDDQQQQPPPGQGNQGDSQPQRPPIIELAEAKMLRWLQVDLNQRTRLYEADLADQPEQREQKREVTDRLVEEQQRLEELVREMMERTTSPERPVETL